MSFSLWLRMVVRSARGARGRLLWLAASVALGVAAVVGVLAVTAALDENLRTRSREFLGGDLAVDSRQPLPDVAAALPARYRDAARVSTISLTTMAQASGGQTRLVELRALEQSHGHYPLAGELLLAPRRPLAALLDDHSALVATELLTALSLKVGDALSIGGVSLRITGTIEQEPDPVSFSFSLGPRVLISAAALARTSLLQFGNRVRYRTLIALPQLQSAAELGFVKQHVLSNVPGGGTYVSVETHREAQPALRQMLTRVESFTGLVALLSLLVAGVGVAQSVSTWLRGIAPQTAIYRCLGFRPRDVFVLYLSLVVLSALLGSLLGIGIGTQLPGLLARWAPQLLLADSALTFSLRAAGRGLELGLLVPVGCSLVALRQAAQASPHAVLRGEARSLSATRGQRLALACSAVLALFLVAWQQSGQLRVALAFSAGVALLVLVLAGLARLLTRLLARAQRRGLPVSLWYGAATLTRPSSRMLGSVLTLGVGTLVVLSIALSHELLGRALAGALPAAAPSLFLLDVQPDQWDELRALCVAEGAEPLSAAPVVMARLSAIDGRSVRELVRARPGDANEQQRAHRLLTREQRISWSRNVPPDNRIVEGTLWRDAAPNEVSVEQDFARELGIRLGSALRFDVQGAELDFKVTSLRSVQWRSFSTNFFLLVEPGSLDGAPSFRIAAVRAAPALDERLESRISARFPNVTVLRVRSLIARAMGMLVQLALAVQLLGSFAMGTGLLTLAGAVAASQLERQREVALLKTLGVTRAGVLRMLAFEYLLFGLLSGLIGGASAYLLTWLVARLLLELPELPSLGLGLLGIAGVSALALVAGLLASTRALWVSPSRVLRGRG